MRVTSLASLLAATCNFCSASFVPSEVEPQTPLRIDTIDKHESEYVDWDKDPSVDATGNLIFNSVSEIMLLWPNTVISQGHSIAPVSIPVGTVFYHGRPDANIPTNPEWLAFDFEHSYFFARGDNGHVLTLAASRALRVIDFDGLSAHMSPDTAEIVQYGEVKDNGGWGGEGGNEGLTERLCGWAAPLGIDGFIRMEGHFELIQCNFTDSFTLLEAVKVLPSEGRGGPGGGGGRNVPDGWIGSLPTDIGAEVDVAGHWHDRAPGETRVQVHYDKFISFYDPEVTSLIAARRGLPRGAHRIKGISKAEGMRKRAELEDAVKRSWDAKDGSGVDWASIVRVVIERYAERLEVLAYTLDTAGQSHSVQESAFKARQQVLLMLAPHFTTADTPGETKGWLTLVVGRCARRHTQGLPDNGRLTKQERLIRGAVEEVMHEICRRLARMFHVAYDIERGDVALAGKIDLQRNGHLDIQGKVDTMQAEVTALMAWLDWVQMWVRCAPGCKTDEMCVISGKGEARRRPKCVLRPNV